MRCLNDVTEGLGVERSARQWNTASLCLSFQEAANTRLNGLFSGARFFSQKYDKKRFKKNFKNLASVF